MRRALSTVLVRLKQQALNDRLRGFDAFGAAIMQRLIEAASKKANECNYYAVNTRSLLWRLCAIRISDSTTYLPRDQIKHDESGCKQKAKNPDFRVHVFSLID
jgi:hypothetical protein